jgi:hypothetical protein
MKVVLIQTNEHKKQESENKVNWMGMNMSLGHNQTDRDNYSTILVVQLK